jgi:hypothetical protein
MVLAADAGAEGYFPRPQCRAGLGADPAPRFGAEEKRLMCNLYGQTEGQQAILELIRALRDTTGILSMQPGIACSAMMFPFSFLRSFLFGTG